MINNNYFHPLPGRHLGPVQTKEVLKWFVVFHVKMFVYLLTCLINTISSIRVWTSKNNLCFSKTLKKGICMWWKPWNPRLRFWIVNAESDTCYWILSVILNNNITSPESLTKSLQLSNLGPYLFSFYVARIFATAKTDPPNIPGVFLMKGHCFLNQESGEMLISLGFRFCAALGVPLISHKFGANVPCYSKWWDLYWQYSYQLYLIILLR